MKYKHKIISEVLKKKDAIKKKERLEKLRIEIEKREKEAKKLSWWVWW